MFCEKCKLDYVNFSFFPVTLYRVGLCFQMPSFYNEGIAYSCNTEVRSVMEVLHTLVILKTMFS